MAILIVKGSPCGLPFLFVNSDMATERILTHHPEGKAGVNIDKGKYNLVRDGILAVLRDKGPTGFTDLLKLLKIELSEFEGSVPWYLTTVKLDMEARGIIRRSKKDGRQVLELIQ